jgi:hypothetical protein
MIIVKLLTKKKQLVNRLEKSDLGPDERAEHETVLAKIDNALDLLEPAITKQEQQSEAERTAKAAARRARKMGEQKPRSSAMSDRQRALALVRWRQKVRRNA